MKLKLVPVLLLAILLTACGAGQSGQAVPTVVLGAGGTPGASATQPVAQAPSGEVTASGVVVPAQEAQLAFPLPGIVAKVDVAEGDQVKAGDVLVELENSDLQMQVTQAERAVRELSSPSAVAAAEKAVVDDQKVLDDAQDKRDSYNYKRASQEQLENAQANLTIAQDQRDETYDVYQHFKNYPADNPRRAQAYTAYYAAVNAVAKAQSNLNWLVGGPSAEDVALADAELHAAQAATQEAQWYLSELKGETIPADATGAQLAQLQQAREALKAAQDQLDRTHLLSPLAGTIADVGIVPGEYVLPGQVLVAISDLANLQVETSDLSELDVPEIKIGQEVSVRVKALGTDIPGHVISISPVPTSLGGDVVYKTTIGLDSIPEGLRSGMSATVDYLP